MSSNPNEYAYAKQFVGSLRRNSETGPVQVNTRVRVVTGLSASEVQEYKSRMYDAAPRYTPADQNLPLHPSLQAMAVGRHYFTW